MPEELVELKYILKLIKKIFADKMIYKGNQRGQQVDEKVLETLFKIVLLYIKSITIFFLDKIRPLGTLFCKNKLRTFIFGHKKLSAMDI